MTTISMTRTMVSNRAKMGRIARIWRGFAVHLWFIGPAEHHFVFGWGDEDRMLFHDGFLSWSMGMPVYAINAAVLALAWAVLVASEGRVPGRHWLAAVQARCSPALTGMGVALVLCVAQVNASHFFAAVTLRKLASGSAEAGALAVPLLHLGLGAALQLALTLAAAGWLMRHWRLRQAGARSLGLFALAPKVPQASCALLSKKS